MGLRDFAGLPSADDMADDMSDPADDMGSAKEKKVRAIKRLFAAMKANDPQAGAEAFADAFQACETYESDDDASDEEDDGEGG